MRLPVSLFIVLAMFLTSCANEGVIVRKDSRPFPFYASLGVDGMYTFLLRDNGGTVRRQMVTPEVYEQYVVGDHFNDLQPGPLAHGDRSDDKNMRTAAFSPAKRITRVAAISSSHSNRGHVADASRATRGKKIVKTAARAHKTTRTALTAARSHKAKGSSAAKSAIAQRRKNTHHVAKAGHLKHPRKHSSSDIVFINGAPGLR